MKGWSRCRFNRFLALNYPRLCPEEGISHGALVMVGATQVIFKVGKAKEATSADGPAATSWTVAADELGHGWQNLWLQQLWDSVGLLSTFSQGILKSVAEHLHEKRVENRRLKAKNKRAKV